VVDWGNGKTTLLEATLAGAPGTKLSPIDRLKRTRSFSGAQLCHSLPALYQSTQSVKRAEVALFMTLYAAFDTLLYLYTGSDDIAQVRHAIANRNRPEIEGLIGFLSIF